MMLLVVVGGSDYGRSFQGKGNLDKSDTTGREEACRYALWIGSKQNGQGLACLLTLPRRSKKGLSSLQASSGSTTTSCFPSSGPWLSRSGPKAAGLFLFGGWGIEG